MKKTKKKLFTRVLSLVLVLAMCLGTPITAKAGTYAESGVYSQSDGVIVTPGATSAYIDFSPSLNYLRESRTLGTTLVTVKYYDTSSKEITATLAPNV